MINPDAKRVVRIQLRLTLLAMLVGLVVAEAPLNTAMSVLLGGLCAIIPALVYIRIAGTLQRGDPAAIMPAAIMRSHYRAAAAKFILTLLLFGGVLLFFKDLSVPGLFGGFIAATSAYWFGLLIKN